MRVRDDVRSSNRTAYPTSPPRSVPRSWATRRATETAACSATPEIHVSLYCEHNRRWRAYEQEVQLTTRRGCVTPIVPSRANPASSKICDICVVLPLPVSPMTTVTGFWLTLSTICCAYRLIGRSLGSDMRATAGAQQYYSANKINKIATLLEKQNSDAGKPWTRSLNSAGSCHLGAFTIEVQRRSHG